MNLLFLEQRPRFGGGSERIGLSLCTHMHRAGHLTHLLYETEGDMVSAFASVTKSVTQARVRPLAVRHPLEAAGSLAALLGLVRTQSIDVIFTSQLGYVSLLAVTASLKGVPSVVHLGLALSFGSPLYRWSQPRVAAAVAPSQHTLEACQRLGWPVARLQVIPNGVDLEQFHPSDSGAGVRTRLGVPDGFPLVAYVGRLVEEKGIFTLVRAAAELKRRGSPFTWRWWGLRRATNENGCRIWQPTAGSEPLSFLSTTRPTGRRRSSRRPKPRSFRPNGKNRLASPQSSPWPAGPCPS